MFDLAKIMEIMPKIQQFIDAVLSLVNAINREQQMQRLILSKIAEDRGIDVAALEAQYTENNDTTRSA